MHTGLFPGDLVATTREITRAPKPLDPAHPDGAPIPVGTLGAVCRHVAGGCVMVDFDNLGLKAVPASALELVASPDHGDDPERSWNEELLDLVLKQYLEIQRLQAVIAELHIAAPPRLTTLPQVVEMEKVTLPGGTAALASEMQREGWIEAETREDGAVVWCRLRKS